MLKLYKGDLLVFTNNGFKNASEVTKNDLLLCVNNDGSTKYDEIEEITKIYKKKYKLNKIDNYLINDNIELFSLKNIPSNIEINEINDYLERYAKNCIGLTKIGELSTFDYFGFPTINNNIDNYNEDHMRFIGLITNNYLNLNINKNKETIDFLKSYLTKLNINYDIKEEKEEINFKINEELPKITPGFLFILSKKNLIDFYSGLIELNRDIIIDINDKNLFLIIKYTCLLLGMSISSLFKDGKILIKLPKKINNLYYNYFNYDNNIWTKIRSIKKIQNYTGNLFYIKTKNNNPYLTDIGFIS